MLSACLTLLLNVSAQTTPIHQAFFQPEYTFGKISPNYGDTFPNTNFQQGIGINIGSINTDTSSWAKYYNFSEAGVFINYFNFGNNKVFGHEIGFTPYVTFPVFNKAKGNYHLKLGLGLAYFTTHFDSFTNPSNQVIGSDFTWDFKLFLYRDIYSTNNFNLRLGFGFSHESNGHVQIPNLGINSGLLSLSGQFFTRKKTTELPARVKGRNHAPKKFFVHYRQGLGIHEQSESEGPKLYRKKPVFASSFGIGYTFNKHLKLRTGFTYKFYEQYYTHLIENDVPNLSNHPKLNATDIVFYVGNEYLMSHFSIDTEVGINLYKPFYWEFNKSSIIATTLMKIIATRLGINAYLFNTNKLPANNLFVGVNLNANLAKADFTEISIGYTHNFK